MTRLASVFSSGIVPGDVRRPIRVGVVIDRFVQPRWVEKVIHSVAACEVAEIALIVKTNPRRNPAAATRHALRRFNELFYSLYSRMDRFFSGAAPDALAPVDLAPCLMRYPVMTASAETDLEWGQLDDADVEEMLPYDLDVLLNFSGRPLEGAILDASRHGIWSYGGDPALTGVWEVLGGSPVTGAALKIQLPGSTQTRVLYRSYTATDRHSVYRNRNNCYAKAPECVVNKLRELSEREALESVPQVAGDAPARRPGNLTVIPAVCRLSVSYALGKLGDLFHRDQWTIGYRVDGELPVLSRAFGEFQALTPPKDRIWSDPFAWKTRGKCFIFLQEKILKLGKGHISVLELNRDGTAALPVKVLDTRVHASYPFLFEWRDEVYMIPDTSGSGTIELYRAKRFPFVWEHHRTLMTGIEASNTALYEADGRWWMFTSFSGDGPSRADNLYLFHADSPLGPWKPHRRNPVKSDVRSARTAGRLFAFEGALYRPAQDGSGQHGSAVVIQRVDVLNPDDYREREVSRITPHWRDDLISTHTFNFFDDVTVVDMKLRRRRLG